MKKNNIQKIVINSDYGGFSLSHKAIMEYAKLKGIKLYPVIDDISKKVYGKKATLSNPAIFIHYYTQPSFNDKYYFSDRDIERDDICLIKVVEKLGKKASGQFADLKIVKIPDDIEWEIEEYDGNEWISEKHKTWD